MSRDQTIETLINNVARLDIAIEEIKKGKKRTHFPKSSLETLQRIRFEQLKKIDHLERQIKRRGGNS